MQTKVIGFRVSDKPGKRTVFIRTRKRLRYLGSPPCKPVPARWGAANQMGIEKNRQLTINRVVLSFKNSGALITYLYFVNAHKRGDGNYLPELIALEESNLGRVTRGSHVTCITAWLWENDPEMKEGYSRWMNVPQDEIFISEMVQKHYEKMINSKEFVSDFLHCK